VDNPRKILVVYTLLALVVAGGYWASQLRSPSVTEISDKADTMISFDLPTSTGEKWSTQVVHNKVVLINFWATWCAPCRTEIPLLIAMQARHAHEIQVVGIAVDDAESVRRFEDEVGLNYVSLIGPSEGPELMQRYGSTGQLPFTLVFDRTGVLRHRKTGELQAAELSDWLTRLL
jgi:thiol-disulfide isomerase/thioredoxin